MSDATRKGLAEAETGDESGAPLVVEQEQEHPADAEAAEQEQSEGPEGRGVSR
jgi:hypothetical protein